MGAQHQGAAAAAGAADQDVKSMATTARDKGPAQAASRKAHEDGHLSLCFVCPNVVTSDRRVLTEALYLGERGVAVSAVGFLRKDLSPEEYHGPLRIVRVTPWPGTRDLFRRWMRGRERRLGRTLDKMPAILGPWAWLMARAVHGGGVATAWALGGFDWLLRPALRRVQLVRAARRMGASAYHAHSPLSLFLLVWFMCLLSRKRFARDYRDAFPAAVGEDSGLASHYDLPAAWDMPWAEAMQRRVSDTLDMIPAGTDSVLDVGAGDGRVTNPLVGCLRTVAALDSSLVAVRRARGQRFLGSVSRLPFTERCFDVVVAAEVLEHLPRAIYHSAIRELRSVAGHYIVLSVPNDERLFLSVCRCPRCGLRFHGNLHHRSFRRAGLARLFEPEFVLKKLEETGGTHRSYHRGLLWLRRNVGGVWARTVATVCPRCSFRPAVGAMAEANVLTRFCDRLNERFANKHRPASATHLLALYERKEP